MTQDMILQGRLNPGYNPAITWARILVIGLIALGHISTMPIGPDAREFLFQFGYDPSWLGVNTLFILAGFLAMASLSRHGNPLSLLTTKVKRNFPTLLIYVAAITLIVFPIFGIKSNLSNSLTKHLAIYAFDVLTCIDPGRKLAGLLDNAKYECVIQGAIWTFRWGVIAYIGAAIGWKIGLLRSRKTLFAMTIAGLLLYICVHGAVVLHGLDIPESVSTGLRLGWPFLAGMSLFTCKDTLPKSWLTPALFAALAAIHYFVLPWSPLIEIFATAFWGYTAFILMSYDGTKWPQIVKNVPDLSLGLYVFHWPVAQIILLLLPSLGSLGLLIATAPVTILLSWGIWAAVQNPIAMRRRTGKVSLNNG